MKKARPTLRNLVLLTAILLSACTFTFAQQVTSQKEVKVKIEKNENGEMVIIEETMSVGQNGTSIDAILKQYGIDTEFGNLKDNEEVEIIIRRKTKDHSSQDVRVVLDTDWNTDDVVKQEGKPFLGVYFQNGISQMKAAEIGIKDLSVAYVTSVIENTGAAKAKIQKGDVITAVDGEEIRPGLDLRDIILSHKPGDKVKLAFVRDGKSKKVKAVLGENKTEVKTHSWVNHSEKKRAVPFAEVELFLLKENEVVNKEIHVLIKMENVSQADVDAINKGQEAGGIRMENNLQTSEFKFFPNPNNGQFNLTFDLPEEGNTIIRVYDLNGVTVYQETLNAFSGKYSKDLDISGFSKGIYFLQVEQNGHSINKKVVTQ